MGNDYTPVCVICNNPIPANITPAHIASGVVATHQVDLVAHPSCAYHGKPAFEVGKRTIPYTMNTDLEMVWCALDAVQNDDAIDCWERVTERLRPIPVSERLPEDGVEVLAYDGNWWVAVREDGRWEEPGSLGLQDVPVTHWLALPPKPE